MDIAFRFINKKPGPEMDLQPSEMIFDNDCSSQSPEAYEMLLLDAMRGDATLFMRADQVEEAWDVITPILEVWESGSALDFPNYAAGTRGPEAADGRRPGRRRCFGRRWLETGCHAIDSCPPADRGNLALCGNRQGGGP